MQRLSFLVIFTTVIVAGCLDAPPKLDNLRFACSTDADCIEGYVCRHSECSPVGDVLDAGVIDSGAKDSGMDAGRDDGGSFDAGPPDSGQLDGGKLDAGQPDAGRVDAGAKFTNGDRVVSSALVNVRAMGSTTAAVNGNQLPSATGTVIGGPVESGGVTFWQVNYANGADGWTSEAFLDTLVTDAGQAGPVAWWRFSEDAGITTADSSGNGNTGTLVNGPQRVAGRVGLGMSFSGAFDGGGAYVVVPHSSSLDLRAAPFAFSAWVNPRSHSTLFRSIFVKNYTYYLYANASSAYCGTGGGTFVGFSSSMGPGWACHGTLLPLDTWTLVTANYDGAYVTLYKGSTQVASRASSSVLTPGDGGLQIGASKFGEYFDGIIDEVLIYPRVLSLDEVAALAAGPQG